MLLNSFTVSVEYPRYFIRENNLMWSMESRCCTKWLYAQSFLCMYASRRYKDSKLDNRSPPSKSMSGKP